MDADAREVVGDIARRAVTPHLDALAAEVDALRRELVAVRRAAGLPNPRLPREDRLREVAAMRREGLSMRAIAVRAGVHRVTVAQDLRALGMTTPATTTGIDGVTRRHRPAQ